MDDFRSFISPIISCGRQTVGSVDISWEKKSKLGNGSPERRNLGLQTDGHVLVILEVDILMDGSFGLDINRSD